MSASAGALNCPSSLVAATSARAGAMCRSADALLNSGHPFVGVAVTYRVGYVLSHNLVFSMTVHWSVEGVEYDSRGKGWTSEFAESRVDRGRVGIDLYSCGSSKVWSYMLWKDCGNDAAVSVEMQWLVNFKAITLSL
jgi:hypothetical protein